MSQLATSSKAAFEVDSFRTTDGARVLEIAPDVACVQLSLVNLYLVGLPGERDWVLVDAGLFNSAGTIIEAAARRFGPNKHPKAIVLTHGHFDHVGALEHLLRVWDVPVYAHLLEMPYLDGRCSYPPFDPAVGGGGMAYLSFLYPRAPAHIGSALRVFNEDSVVPHLPGWRCIFTPGHTPGHVSLWRESDRLMIAGDAVVTTQQESAVAVLTQSQKVWRPPAYATTDWAAARDSVRRILELQPEMLATGHGVPMQGPEMRRQLSDLVRDWDRHRPQYGRYVSAPAVQNEQGVVFVPPPVVSPQLVAMAGVGAGLLLGAMLLGRRRDV